MARYFTDCYTAVQGGSAFNPNTNIQTDSYVAVQLLEQDGRLDAETIGK